MKKTMAQVALTTVKHPYEILREISAADDTDLTDSTMQDGLPNGVVTKSTKAQIIMFGTDDEDEAGTWALYGQTRNGPAELIATGTVALGDVETGEPDEYYANNIVISVQKWLSTIVAIAADNVSLYIAKLEFDCFGYDKIWLSLTKDTAASLGAKIRWI